MKTHWKGLILVVLVGFVGCQQSPPGGPGVKDKDSNRNDTPAGTPDNSFRLTLPSTETKIKQGELDSRTKSMAHEPGGPPVKSTTTQSVPVTK